MKLKSWLNKNYPITKNVVGFWYYSENTDFKALSDAVNYHKETEKGVVSVCQAVEDYGYDREKIGRAEGQAKIIKSLIETGMSVEEIAKATKISVEEVKKLAE